MIRDRSNQEGREEQNAKTIKTVRRRQPAVGNGVAAEKLGHRQEAERQQKKNPRSRPICGGKETTRAKLQNYKPTKWRQQAGRQTKKQYSLLLQCRCSFGCILNNRHRLRCRFRSTASAAVAAVAAANKLPPPLPPATASAAASLPSPLRHVTVSLRLPVCAW